MCGRYSLATDERGLEDRFDFRGGDLRLAAQYNIAPTQAVLSITNDGQENRARYVRWGLIPWWAKDPSIGNRMINARAETLTQRASFRDAFARRRCLVIADGFYEWRRVDRRRWPMRVVLKSGEPFAFAGLWEVWRDPKGQRVRSCTIITTEANSLVGSIHDRMPVILAREAESTWLDPAIRDAAALSRLLAPYPSEGMDAYEVSVLVNSPKNNVPECLRRLD